MAEKKTSSESVANPPATDAGEQSPPERVTKKELVRRALAAMGNDATPTEIQKHLKETYDVDMKLGHISTTKGELRRAAQKQAEEAAQAEQAASEEASEEPAEPAESAEPPQKPAKITGVDAVRQVLPELGKDPEPVDIQRAVKERFDLDLKLDYVAKLKGKIQKELKKQKQSKKPATKPAEKEEAATQPKEPAAPKQAAPAAGNGKEEVYSDILALWDLVDRLGADKVRTLLRRMTGQS